MRTSFMNAPKAKKKKGGDAEPKKKLGRFSRMHKKWVICEST